MPKNNVLTQDEVLYFKNHCLVLSKIYRYKSKPFTWKDRYAVLPLIEEVTGEQQPYKIEAYLNLFWLLVEH